MRNPQRLPIAKPQIQPRFADLTPAKRSAILDRAQAAYETSLPRYVSQADARHGMTAMITRAHVLSNGYTSAQGHGNHARAQRHYSTRGMWNGSEYEYPQVLRTQIQMYQSNGFVLYFDSLRLALLFARGKRIPCYAPWQGLAIDGLRTGGRGKKRRLC